MSYAVEEIQWNGTPIFQRNWECKKKYVINRGGARSSKSYSILQLLMIKFANEDKKMFLITRKTMPALRRTAYKVFVDMLKENGLYPYCEHNKTQNTITYQNNYIAFDSIDDPVKIKSTEFNYIFMEEANEFSWDDFMVLHLRLSAPTKDGEVNQMFLAFNPTDELGYINKKLSKWEEAEVIHSTYLDNPFLDAAYLKLIEDLKEQDPVYWTIYGLGEYAQLINIIYKPYKMVDSFPDNCSDWIYGLDFGFNSATALVRIGWQELESNDFFLQEKLYP